MDLLKQIGVKLRIVSDKAGLDKISGDFLGLAGDLAEPIFMLTQGASKTQAAWAGMKGLMEAKVLGPLSLVAGASTAALAGINALSKSFADMGMAGAANLESIETRFKAVLRSQALARQQVQDNVRRAKETPYAQDQVMEANRSLEILTDGALSAESGMTMVGDAAATAGEEIGTVAQWTGRLYDALRSGAPIGEATMRLQEMGIMSGQTRRTLDSMVESGTSFSDMWGVVEVELRKSEGAMKDLSKNLEGLQSTYEDTTAVMGAKFSEGFLEGEKARIDSQTKALEKMTPAVEFLGRFLGSGSNAWEKFKANMLETITGIPGFTSLLKAGSVALISFLSVMSVASTVAITKYIISLVSANANLKRLTKETGTIAGAQKIQSAVTKQLSAATMELNAATNYLAQGNIRGAASSARLATAQAASAVKMNASAAASVGLRGALSGVGKMLTWVVGLFRQMLVAVFTNPIVGLIAGILAVVGAMALWAKSITDAKKRLEEFNEVTDDTVTALEAERRAIKTSTDLMKAHQNAVSQLAKAKAALAEATVNGSKDEIDAARRREAAMEEQLRGTNQVNRSELALTDAEKERHRSRIEQAKTIKESLRDEARSNMSPEEKIKDIEKEAKEVKAAYDKANRELAEQENVKRKQSAGAMENEERSINIAELEGKITTLRATAKREALAAANEVVAMTQGGDTGEAEAEAVREKYRKQEEVIKEEIERLQRLGQESQAGLEAAFGSNSQVAKLTAKTSLRDRISTTDNSVADLTQRAGQAEDGKEKQSLLEELESQERILKSLKALAKQYNVELSEGANDRDKLSLESAQKEIAENSDYSKVVDAEIAARDAAKERQEVEGRRLETEKAIVGIKDTGLAGDLRSLEIQKESVQLAFERNKLSRDEYQNQTAILGVQMMKARQDAENRSKDASTDTRVKFLEKQEELYRKAGMVQEANAERTKADDLRDQKRQRELEKQAKTMFETEAEQAKFVEERMTVEKQVRDQARRYTEEDQEKKRKASKQNSDLSELELKEEAARFQGKTKVAEQYQKAQDKIADDKLREQQRQKYLNEGNTLEDAYSLAARDVTTSQATRELDKLKSAGTGQITASSLRRVGGGGQVVGNDPVSRRIDITNELLKKILEKNDSGEITVN